MRHYLLNDRQIGPRLKASVVLAEKANQLYRDTNYTDLISFEEDIAKISTMVLVIVESPGSFAEVGAFSANDTIRKSLTILMQEKYAEGESFIRFGPVERIKKDDPDRVAFFPWRLNGKNSIIKSSARSHVADIIRFINNQVTRIPTEQKFINNSDIQIFIVLYWIIHTSMAISISKLTLYFDNIHNFNPQFREVDPIEIRKALYCMKLAGWIESIHYSNIDYYCCTNDIDPFRYKFKSEALEKDSIRRKSDVVAAIQHELSLPKYVRSQAASKRGAISK